MGGSKSNPVIGYKFKFVFGKATGGFSKVKNIERKVDRYYYNEGGVNDYPVILAGQQQTPHKLVLEKGFISSYSMKSIFDKDATNDIHVSNSGSLHVLGEDGKTIRTFTFRMGRISEWSTSSLDAAEPGIMIDSLTILHSGLIEEKPTSEKSAKEVAKQGAKKVAKQTARAAVTQGKQGAKKTAKQGAKNVAKQTARTAATQAMKRR